MTAHRKLRGRNFEKEIVDIDKSVWYAQSKSKGNIKLASRWETAIWLGIREEFGDIIVGTSEGVIKVRTVTRKGSEEERWNILQLN